MKTNEAKHQVSESQIERIEAWKSCITRIGDIGAIDDAVMLRQMLAHLAQIEAELGGKVS